jgi:hypothetical protein
MQRFYLTLILSLSIPALAQQTDPNQMPGMPGMSGMPASHNMQTNFAGMYLMTLASGTAMNPQSWTMPMIMKHTGDWSLMFMGNAFLVDTQQSGPRGGDKLYSTNWFMISAEHPLGRGSFMIQSMFSLEPATVTDRRYPLLFQTGETAYGKPLVDAQHPHNFVMGLGLHYARPVGGAILDLYYAPVGDPALGPVAFPHRASAYLLPQAPIGHHWEDSTHIATNVVTAAVKYQKVRLEMSGFNGTEPGENRWTINWGPINSYSGRLSYFPTRDWLLQVSAGHLVNPEPTTPGNVVRVTSSAQYTRKLSAGDWSSSLIWGRNHEASTGRNLDAFTFETLFPVRRRDFLTGRVEVVQKDELVPSGNIFRIGAYTAGYTRDIAEFEYAALGLGFNMTTYSLPAALRPLYGERPVGGSVFLRLLLRQRQ